MFFMHSANNPRHLLRHLFEVRRSQPMAPLEPELFLIHNQGMARWLQQQIAFEDGVHANASFLFPQAFFSSLGQKLSLQIDFLPFSREVLTWRLYQRLGEEKQDDSLKPLQAYHQNDLSGLKRFQLAGQLAHVLDQYQMRRLDWLSAWESKQTLGLGEDEVWQAELWRQLLIHQSPSSTERTPVPQGVFFQEIGKALETIHTGLPTRIQVMGLSSLPPCLMDLLWQIGRVVDVHFFLLSPTSAYWQDLKGNRERGLSEPERPLSLLLAQCSTRWRELQTQWLNQPDPVQEFFSFAPHEPVTSCLQQLQNDLLMAFEPESSPQATLVKDESLQIHSCHTAMREAEIVAECLKKAMHQHPEWHWHDMAIMAPDIELYASALQAALGDLPHTIADRPWPTHEAMADAWLAILSLLDGRFEWDRVLSLLERPLVQEWLNLTPQEIKDLEHWVEVAAIRWGLNHEHVREQGLPDCGPITWEDGLDRLLMGWMMRTSTHIGHCFPVNGIEGEALKPLASLLALLSCLEEGAALAAQPPKGQEWVEWIQSWLDRWQDQKTLPNGTMRAVLATLQRTWEDLELDEPMPLAVFRNAFQQAIGSQSGMRGFLHGSITCCSLLPMRAIPFRFLAVMGMNEGAFPAKDHGLAFDLMATEKGRRPADRSRRQDQRHQFIELILTAEDRLIFTFQGRSQQKNEPQPPALLLEQLHQAFFQQHGVDLLQEHPLKRYHPRNFSSSGWLSSDASAFHLAQLMAKSLVAIAKPLPGNWWMRPGIPQEKPIKTISLTEFLAFFRNPQKQFLKTTLGWQEQPLPQKPVAEELVDLDSLQAYHLKSRILETLLAGTALDHLYMRLLAEGQCPPGQPGQLLFVEECARIEPFAKFVCQAISGSQKEKKQISLHLGGYHLIGELLTYSGRLVFARPTTLKPKDRFNAFLLHLVSRSWTDQDTLVLAMDDSCPKGFRIVRLLGHSPDELLPFLVHFDQGLTHPLDLPIDLGDKLDTLWRHQPLDSENFHKFQEAFIKNLKSGPFLAPPPEERTLLFPNPEKVQFSSEVYKQYQDLMAPVWESFE